MQVTTEDVFGAIAIYKKYSVIKLLQESTTSESFGSIASLLTRGGAITKLNDLECNELSREIALQANALYAILAPIWLARGRKLPVISTDDIYQVFDRGEKGQWVDEKTYITISTANAAWACIVNACREKMDSFSQVIVAGIAEAFLGKIDPLEAEEATPAVGKSSTQSSDVDPDITASVNQQLKDLLG